MSCILDIDLDYFRLFNDPIGRLDEVLGWARRPVDVIVDEHHKVLNHWDRAIETGVIEAPTFILHVDEHHDMLSEQPPVQFGNFLYFAMRKWPDCRVHWLTQNPIDDPTMWLSEDAWASVGDRFRSGSNLNSKWPSPKLVSVCTSPGFIDKSLSQELLERIDELGYGPNNERDRGSDSKGVQGPRSSSLAKGNQKTAP